MKAIFKYLGILASVLAVGMFASCNIQEIEDDDTGLGIKTFFPTKVVANQPMTISGKGFSNVKEIVFPDGITVTDFETVGNGMIRLKAPRGIAAGGGNIIVRSDKEEAKSEELISLGKTVVSGFSKQAGEEVEGGQQITIYGTDLEFICAVELLDADGNPNLITDDLFYRKGTSSVIIIVPKTNIFEGTFIGKIYTYDGMEFDMPELSYKPSKNAGHWETVKKVFWANDGSIGAPSWDGKYRFGLDGKDGNNECCATFPQEVWDIIKDGNVRVAFELTGSSNIRITTGWWSADYGGKEHNCVDMIQEEEDGTTYIELDIKGEGSIHDLIDDQHLLFTGSDYVLTAIYTVEEIWIEGEEGHWEHESFWKNDGSIGEPSWDGKYRFGLDGHDGNSECCATFPQEIWDIIKDGKVRVALGLKENSNIRITTGWWSADYGGKEHNCADMVQEEEDGTKYIELDIKGEGSIHDLIDDQHLLFTGSDYTVLEIYLNKWVEGTSGAPEEVVLWENDGTPVPSWGGTFRFCNVDTVSGEQIHAFSLEEWEIIKEGTIYFVYQDNGGANVRITTGWWTGAYGGTDYNCAEIAEDYGDGQKVIKMNIKEDGNLYGNIDAQHLLFTGDAYTPVKIFYYK